MSGFFGDFLSCFTPSTKRCFSIQEFTRFEIIHYLSGVVISRIWKTVHFKWAGHRFAHVFAGGWKTASHKRNRTLFETPTGKLLFYYKNIKQESVHTLLLEEFGLSKKWVFHGQETKLKCNDSIDLEFRVYRQIL